jgi:hypothetical protein
MCTDDLGKNLAAMIWMAGLASSKSKQSEYVERR